MRHSILSAVALLAFAACAPTSGAYLKHSSASPDAVVTLSEGTTTASIARQLRALGFGISAVTDDTVKASTRGGGFVNCSRITQYRDGGKSVYPGSTPLSIFYRKADNQGFFTRQVAVLTQATVTLDGRDATVAERHAVTMRWSASDGSGSKEQTKAVTGGKTVTFEDGTVCATSSRIAQQLR